MRRLSRPKLFASLLLAASIGAYLQLFAPMSFAPQRVVVEIEPGMTTRQISQTLAHFDLVRSAFVFRWAVRFAGADTDLRQGEYELDRKMSLVRIIAVLRGRVPGLKLVRVTIPEGYSVAKIAKLLESKELISAPKFLEYVRNAKPELEAKFPFLSQVPTSNLEGYLFPETYLFAHGVSSAVVTEAFLGQFQRRVLPIWNSISASANISLHEAVTLASMIEKEAHDPAEMRLISAVFHNRLKKRINLASDPTVLYALGEPEKEIVTYADLRVDSPFNTYRRPGLPPTPIASPGAHAFAAALHPENSDFLYFVANGDGTHSFSRTLQEHVTKTRRIQRQLAKK